MLMKNVFGKDDVENSGSIILWNVERLCVPVTPRASCLDLRSHFLAK